MTDTTDARVFRGFRFPAEVILLGLLLTCAKLGVSFWDYLGHRLGVPETTAPYLPDLVRLRSAHA